MAPQVYQIRKAKVSDAAQITRLLEMFQDQPYGFDFSLGKERIATQEVARLLAYIAHSAASFFLLAADPAGEPLGFLYLLGGQTSQTAHRASLGMAVSPALQNQGIGQALLQEALLHARRCPYLAKIDLQVRTDHAGAIHLYKKAGFRAEGCLRRAIFTEGVFYDCLLMGCCMDG